MQMFSQHHLSFSHDLSNMASRLILVCLATSLSGAIVLNMLDSIQFSYSVCFHPW